MAGPLHRRGWHHANHGPAAPTVTNPAALQKASASPVTSSLPILSSNTKKALGFVGGGLLAVGVVYYIKKRRG